MFLDYCHNAAYVQQIETRAKYSNFYCYDNEGDKNSSESSSESKSSGPESVAEAIIDMVNNPGTSLGGWP